MQGVDQIGAPSVWSLLNICSIMEDVQNILTKSQMDLI